MILYYFDLKFTPSERYALHGRTFIKIVVQRVAFCVTHVQFGRGLLGDE